MLKSKTNKIDLLPYSPEPFDCSSDLPEELYFALTPIILKTAVEHIKIPFALSLSKGGLDFGMLTKWVGMWKPLMLRQAQHERLPHLPTAVFRIIVTSDFYYIGWVDEYMPVNRIKIDPIKFLSHCL